MSCKDYLKLKPGMEVLITDHNQGFIDKKVVIKEISANFYNNKSIGYDICFEENGREYYLSHFYTPSVTFKPCKKINVKDLCVGDVIERGDQRGFVTYIQTDGANIHWFVKGSKHGYAMSYFEELDDVEIVGHVDLWNL
jgi:hypothetical protein